MQLIERLRTQIGEERVRPATERDTYNLTEFAPRSILAVVEAQDVEDCQFTLHVARETHTTVYPVSTGRNWGLGSRLPVRGDTIVLDMSAMKRAKIDFENRVALVEPGVTQLELHNALAGSDLIANVTGAGPETSLVGNALERGVGILGPRAHEIMGFEVLMPQGGRVRFGAMRPELRHYPEGFGPDYRGLMLQSNLGIVVEMALALFVERPVELGLFVFADDVLESVIGALRSLREHNVISDRIEIDFGTDPRVAELLGDTVADHCWVAWLPIYGDTPIRTSKRRLAKAQLDLHGRFKRFTLAQKRLPEAVKARFDLLAGVPSSFSIDSIAATFGVHGAPDSRVLDEDRRIFGFVCALPAVPFIGREVRRVSNTAHHMAKVCGVDAHLSFNSIGTRALEGYLRVVFDRNDPSQVQKAHAWRDRMHEWMEREGPPPMRLDVEQQPRWTRTDELSRGVKKAFDPNGLIAPGRYLT